MSCDFILTQLMLKLVDIQLNASVQQYREALFSGKVLSYKHRHRTDNFTLGLYKTRCGSPAERAELPTAIFQVTGRKKAAVRLCACAYTRRNATS